MQEYTDNFTDLARKSVMDFVFYKCGLEDCRPGQFYGPRRRDYHFIHFVLRGEGTLNIRSASYPVHGGQIFIVPAGDVSIYRASEQNPWTYGWVGFLGIQSRQFLSTLMQCSRNQYVLDCSNVDRYLDRIRSVLAIEGNGIAKHLRSNGMLYDIIGTLLEENGADEARNFGFSIPHLARQYMELHYQDRLRISDVAAAVGVHVNYLSHVFSCAYNMSPKQFLTDLKIRKAKDLLLTTDDPVYTVAHSVGFTDPLAFSKFFRRSVGTSPTDFRAQRRHPYAEHM